MMMMLLSIRGAVVSDGGVDIVKDEVEQRKKIALLLLFLFSANLLKVPAL